MSIEWMGIFALLIKEEKGMFGGLLTIPFTNCFKETRALPCNFLLAIKLQ